MEKQKFVEQIQALLHENGAVKELQTKIRSELIHILMNKRHLKPIKDVSEQDKAINLLVIEHLMQKGLWYTASIMSAEAEFIEPPPEIETVTTSSYPSGVSKRQNPAKLSHLSIANILRNLNNADLASNLSAIDDDYQRSRSRSLLSFCLTNIHASEGGAYKRYLIGLFGDFRISNS